MKEPVINHKKNYALVSKYKRKYEKDFVKQFPECEIVYERGNHKNKIEVMKESLDKQRTAMEEKLSKSIEQILTDLKEKAKTPEQIAEYEKIKEILEKIDVQI